MTKLAFDIDGTIFDCGNIVGDAFSEGARTFAARYGIALPDYSSEEIMRVVGLPTDEIFSMLYPSLNTHHRHILLKESQKALATMVRNGGGRLIEGVCETLDSLSKKGYRICAASNGTKEYIEAILKTHDLFKYFEPLVVIDEKHENKSAIVRQYIQQSPFGDRFIMIGDRQSDIDAARDNAIPFIGCAFGHMGSSEIERERWIARKFEDIPALVQEIENAVV